MNKSLKSKPRDRDETERRILDAAMVVLADGGHEEFGVNAIARRAECDKQLIYRYFGGLEGLADAIGGRLAEQLTQSLAPFSEEAPPGTYGALMRRLILALLDLLRADPVMQRVIAWEVTSSSPIAARMVSERSKRLITWMQAMRGGLQPPEGLDAPAINAILIASTQHLVLSGSANGVFAGMPLKGEADWSRVRTVLTSIVSAVYGD
jgi:AcrR family transcriptional regulator